MSTIENPLLNALLTLAGGDKEVIVVHKSFVRFTGSLEAGSLLDELLYWTPRARLQGGWIAKSDKEWQEELMLSRYSVRKARETLEKMGVIETKKTQFAGAPTMHYRIKSQALTEAWQRWAASRLSEIGQTDQDQDQADCLKSDKRLSETGQTDGADCLKPDKRSSETGQTITETTADTTPTEITADMGSADADRPPLEPENEKPLHQQMFEALAMVCRWDLELLTEDQRGALNQTEKRLRQMKNQTVAPADVLAFGEWWFAYHWQGKKRGESPCPADVRKEWGRFRAWQKQQTKAQATQQRIQQEAEARRRAEQEQAAAEAAADPDLTLARKTWAEARVQLQGSMTRDTYATWIAPLRVLRPNGTFRLQAPTKEILEWVDHRLRPTVERALEGIVGRRVEV